MPLIAQIYNGRQAAALHGCYFLVLLQAGMDRMDVVEEACFAFLTASEQVNKATLLHISFERRQLLGD